MTKRMRTLAPIAALGTATMLVLSACGGGSTDNAGGNDGEPLEVWSRSGPEASNTYEAVFEAFTAKTGIEVDYLATVEFETQLRARAATGDLPDIMIYDQSSMANYVNEGMLLTVDRDALAGADQMSDESWDSVRMADGEYYGVPFSQHPRMTMIRKDWRENVGQDVPKTREELIELAAAFATEDPDGNGVDGDTYGMAVPGTTDRGYFAWWLASPIWQLGGDFVDGGDGKYEAVIDSPESVAAAEQLQGLFCEADLVQPGALTNASATPFFADGQAGIYETGPYAFANFDNAPGKDTYEVIPAPAGPAGGTVLAERTSIYYGASSDKPEQQQALAEYLISAEGQEIGMTAPGQPVVRLPVNESLDAAAIYGDERWAVVQEQLTDSQLFPSDIDFTAIRQDIAETFNAMYGECSQDVAGVLGDLADRIDDELAAQDALR
ncbi:sugar ABC transporter substrate-binding protein [Microbacterium halophytorum]|uniref:sugar ABC transporter substrate-binding protein n=1 Tax=Microbacterium halophytorum TaxID=2067568 RepID=UPI0018E0B394|nr:extracellular solute-binding protein [Microbacterium halophytorum]